MSWTWRLETTDGVAVEPSVEVPEFPSQSDAESWIGEVWRDLADAGVEQVVLLEDDHLIYGPMSLGTE